MQATLHFQQWTNFWYQWRWLTAVIPIWEDWYVLNFSYCCV